MGKKSQQIHHVLVSAVVEALARIFEEGLYADKVIEQTLRSNPKWGARDRRFIAESTYELVRYARWYGALAGLAPSGKSDWWILTGTYLLEKGFSLPPWSEWSDLESESIRMRKEEVRSSRAIRESIPEWLDELGHSSLGRRWDPVLSALNQPAKVVLRVNQLKTNQQQLRMDLLREGVDTEVLGKSGLLLRKRQNVFRTRCFQKGYFEVQDASSQEVAPFLEVHPGMTVIDACAGAGGKSLHLADLMVNKGRIISMDIDEWKLKELARRARRAGVSNIETRLIRGTKSIKRLKGKADRLLLDVPCTGLGVLRRNPDTKWKLRPERIPEILAQQADILDRYSGMLKPGGKMVYATCSILPRENEQQVLQFLDRQHGCFELEKQQHIWPDESGFDGFYMALLQKTGKQGKDSTLSVNNQI